jgi:hypothetical protein
MHLLQQLIVADQLIIYNLKTALLQLVDQVIMHPGCDINLHDQKLISF